MYECMYAMHQIDIPQSILKDHNRVNFFFKKKLNLNTQLQNQPAGPFVIIKQYNKGSKG